MPKFIKIVADFNSSAAREETLCFIFRDTINYLESMWKKDAQTYIKSGHPLLHCLDSVFSNGGKDSALVFIYQWWQFCSANCRQEFRIWMKYVILSILYVILSILNRAEEPCQNSVIQINKTWSAMLWYMTVVKIAFFFIDIPLLWNKISPNQENKEDYFSLP